MPGSAPTQRRRSHATRAMSGMPVHAVGRLAVHRADDALQIPIGALAPLKGIPSDLIHSSFERHRAARSGTVWEIDRSLQ
jgi:hypothetical protein